MKFKIAKIIETTEIIPTENDSVVSFIQQIESAKQSLISLNCDPEQISINWHYDYNYNLYLDVFGYRPENEKEKNKRIENNKKRKENNKNTENVLRDIRYQEFIKLKKEFEND